MTKCVYIFWATLYIYIYIYTFIYLFIYLQKADCESGFRVTIWGSDDGTRLRETTFFYFDFAH